MLTPAAYLFSFTGEMYSCSDVTSRKELPMPRLTLLVLLLLVETAFSFSQDDITDMFPAKLQVPSLMSTAQGNVVIQIQDRTVDPENYIVDSGDIFAVNIMMEIPQLYQLPLLPAGNLLIPGVGTVQLAGLKLSEALEMIEAVCQKQYSHGDIHVSLQQIRSFRVYLYPEGRSPLPLVVTPTHRVLDAYLEFFQQEQFVLKSDTTRFAAVEPDLYPSQVQDPRDFARRGTDRWRLDSSERDIQLKHSSRNLLLHRQGETLQVDLVQYAHTHAIEDNPTLLEGDILEIPLIRGRVQLNGGIMLPGDYEYTAGETVDNLIALGGGFSPDADSSQFIIWRFSDHSAGTATSYESTAANLSMKLEPGDMVQVRRSGEYQHRMMVEIEGEVRYPGSYPLQPGETDIAELLSLAGGYTELADRAKLMVRSDQQDAEQARLLDIPYEQLTELEHSYLRARGWGPGRMLYLSSSEAVELGMDYLLQEGDRITVPARNHFVEVIGAVVNPGRYPFTIGFEMQDYIQLAGGDRKEATRRIYLVNIDTGKRLHYKDVDEVRPGDIIFVEEKVEMSTWDKSVELLQLTATLLTVIVLFNNVTK